jgi:uncharacterized membrane protein
VFLFQSINVMWVHWVIPRLIQRDVTVVVNSLKSLIATSLANPVDWQQPLDATDHFFVSKAIAQRYPHLLESAIVMSFHSYFPPGRMSNQWGNARDAMLDRNRNRALSLFLRVLSVTGVVIGLLQLVGTLNMNVQTFIMSLVLPIAFVAVYVAGAFIIVHPIYLALLAGALAVLVVRHFMKNAQYRRTVGAAEKELLGMPSSSCPAQHNLPDSPGTKVLSPWSGMEVKDANRPDADTHRAFSMQHNYVSGGEELDGSHASKNDDIMALEDEEDDSDDEEEEEEEEAEELGSNAGSSEAECESSSSGGGREVEFDFNVSSIEEECESDDSDIAIREPSRASLESNALAECRSSPHEQVAAGSAASAPLSQQEEDSMRDERLRAAIAVLLARRGRNSSENRDLCDVATASCKKEE